MAKTFDESTLGTDVRASGTAMHGNGAPFGYRLNNSLTLEKAAQGFLIIYDYASTSKFKFFHQQYCYRDDNTLNRMEIMNGVFGSTSAVTSVDVVRLLGTGTFTNATNTSIRLLGAN